MRARPLTLALVYAHESPRNLGAKEARSWFLIASVRLCFLASVFHAEGKSGEEIGEVFASR